MLCNVLRKTSPFRTEAKEGIHITYNDNNNNKNIIDSLPKSFVKKALLLSAQKAHTDLACLVINGF